MTSSLSGRRRARHPEPTFYVYWDWRRLLGTMTASSLDAAYAIAKARYGRLVVVSTIPFAPRTETRA